MSVYFEPTLEIDKRIAASRNAAKKMAGVSDVPYLPTQMKTAISATEVKQHGKNATSKVGIGSAFPSDTDFAEDVVVLPGDLVREYRINLSREIRRTQYSFAEEKIKGREGIVRMTISYLSYLGHPTVTLEQSSGYPELDQDALKTVALAISRVSLPIGAQSANFRVQYALEFRWAD